VLTVNGHGVVGVGGVAADVRHDGEHTTRFLRR
jgi:hypothetical protein